MPDESFVPKTPAEYLAEAKARRGLLNVPPEPPVDETGLTYPERLLAASLARYVLSKHERDAAASNGSADDPTPGPAPPG